MPRSMSDRKKRPSVSREARTARIFVLPATPLPPTSVVVQCGDQAGHEGPVANEVGHVVPAGRGVDRALDLAREVRMLHVEAGVDDRHEPAGTAAHGRDRLAGTHRVVRPRELDAAARVEPVELVDRHRDRRVALDVGHARVGAQRGHGGVARWNGRGDHAGHVDGPGLAPSRASAPRHRVHVVVAADAHEQPGRRGRAGDAGEAGARRRGGGVRGLRQRERHHARAGGARLQCRAARSCSRSIIPVDACADAATSGAAQSSPASTALRTRPW